MGYPLQHLLDDIALVNPFCASAALALLLLLLPPPPPPPPPLLLPLLLLLLPLLLPLLLSDSLRLAGWLADMPVIAAWRGLLQTGPSTCS